MAANWYEEDDCGVDGEMGDALVDAELLEDDEGIVRWIDCLRPCGGKSARGLRNKAVSKKEHASKVATHG